MENTKNNSATNSNKVLAKQDLQKPDAMLTERDVARILSVSCITVKRWRDKGELKALYFGYRTIRYSIEEVERFMAQASYKS